MEVVKMVAAGKAKRTAKVVVVKLVVVMAKVNRAVVVEVMVF